jgi:hypothetical protein
MKLREKIQIVLNNRFPLNNIVINHEGDLEYECESKNEEKEILSYASGLVAGTQININESIKS